MNKVIELLDKDHSLMIDLKDYIKLRNELFEKNMKRIDSINNTGNMNEKTKKSLLDFMDKFKDSEHQFKLTEAKISSSLEIHFKKYEAQMRTGIALFLVNKFAKGHLKLNFLNVQKEVVMNKSKEKIDYSKEYISKVISFNMVG